LKKDILVLKKLKIDYLYLPPSNQIYPHGSNKKIIIKLKLLDVKQLEKKMD